MKIFNITLLIIVLGTIYALYINSEDEKWEYKIELLDQNSAKIKTKTEILTISIDSIQTYIEKDNL